LILESINKDRNKHAKKTFGVDLTAFKGFNFGADDGGAPALVFA